MRALGLATQADPRTRPWTDGAPCRMEAERGRPRCRCRRPQGEKDEDPTTQRGERTAPQNQGRRIAEPGAERPGAVTSLPGGAQEGRAPATSAHPPPPASGSVPTRMTSRWAPPCPPHSSGWRGAHDRAGLSVRALSSPPHVHERARRRPRLAGWKDSRGQGARAGVTRGADQGLPASGFSRRFWLLPPHGVHRMWNGTGLSGRCRPRGPGPQLFTRPSSRGLQPRLRGRPRRSPSLTGGMAGAPRSSGRRISLLRPHFIGAEVTGTLAPRRVFQYKVIFNISFAVSATPT